jgi:transglutaminase-like putative cysteine protease
VELDANVRYAGTTVGPESSTVGDSAWGRRLLVQSVIMELGAQVLFAAAEPVEFSVPARLELLPAAGSSADVRPAVDDLVTAYGRERSYTVVSSIPAVDERTLRSLSPVAGSESGELSFGRYLVLPDSITARTIALSAEIVAGAETPYDQALAIESYLRQFEYDLTVPEPPSQVADVADFFLFELQRGYCDYYATAFVVLARLAGLPTRFATGYAMGGWDPMEGVWVVTEGEAHSWPEVFFSDVGWVAFEPTAGRPTLARIGLPGLTSAAPLPPPLPGTDDVELVDEGETNSQVWFWLIPGAFILWGLVRLIRVLLDRREDPWQSVLRWGEKAGLPMGQGETVIEYGERLAAQVTAEPGRRSATQSGEATRVIAREVRGISREVSRWTYSPPDRRADAKQAVFAQWQRTSGYLRAVQLRRSTSPD